MPRFFTHYWRNQTWEWNRNRADGELLDHTAGNVFQERGVRPGDVVYVVSVIGGSLYVCGKLVVGKITEDVNEAAALLRCEPEELWEADEHVIAAEATPMKFDLEVPLKVARRLRFISGKGGKPLKFKALNYLDEQTLRNVRELDRASAVELDALLQPLEKAPAPDEGSLPEEVADARTYYEGATKRITVNKFERNAKARRACIAHYGVSCFICGFNFKSVYGDAGDGLIHVHHLTPLSEVGEEYELNPVKDLRPVCPNCHAMIHRRTPAYTVEEMRRLLLKK